MRTLAQAVTLLLIGVAALAAPAQQRRDPLTAAETDQLREFSQEPAAKIGLYIRFTRARMEAVDKAHADASLSPQERGRRVHAALEDLEILVDELSDNLESFAKRQQDMRKPLRQVVSMDGDFKARLGALKQQGSEPARAQEFEGYRYLLDDVLESVSGNHDLARDLLEEQNQAAEAAKHKKK